MANTYSNVNFLKLKTAIALTVAPWLGTYEGTENIFTSVQHIFDPQTYSPHLWRFEPLPLIFDEMNLATVPAIWTRGSDPPNAKVVGGIEVILSRITSGLPDVRRPEYYQCEFSNYDPDNTMDAAIEAMNRAWHPLVNVGYNPTYVPRSGIHNEYCSFKLLRGVSRG